MSNPNNKSQHQFLDHAERNYFDKCKLFMEFVQDGMTREDLEKNIARRPALWEPFSVWLDKLPSCKQA